MAPDTEDIDGITFGTDGWRASGNDFSVPRIQAVAQATVDYLDDQDIDGPVAIGYDARESSEGAAKELARVAAASGRDVTVADRDCPTPTLAWTTKAGSYAAGLMVTASHNPPEYNGIKLVDADGAPALPETTDGVADRLRPADPDPPAEHGRVSRESFPDSYTDHVRSFVDADLAGLSVAVDAMHGSARGVTDHLLAEMGATVTRIRCDRDPTFGGESPEPGPDRVAQLRSTVATGDANLGFVHDGDGDRLGVVTPEQGYLDPNLVLALVYDRVLDSERGDAARTVSTSSLVDKIATAAGQQTHETPVGFKWIAEAMAEYDAAAGGEESGGFGVASHLRNKDGVFVATLLAAAHAERPLDDRIDAIRAEYGFRVQDRRSVSCPDEHKSGVLGTIEAEVGSEIAAAAVESVSAVDGRKFHLADGAWVLIRPSGTEPKMRVYAESDSDERTAELLDAGEAAVRATLE
jgi:phosphomannomutase